MSESTNNPAEPPVNDGGGGTPQTDTETTEQQVAAETPVNQGGGSD